MKYGRNGYSEMLRHPGNATKHSFSYISASEASTVPGNAFGPQTAPREVKIMIMLLLGQSLYCSIQYKHLTLGFRETYSPSFQAQVSKRLLKR